MIMKKIYSIIASAIIAVGFTACTQSDFVETSAPDVSATSIDNAIQFGTYMGKVGTTRAGVEGDIISTDVLKGATATNASATVPGFGVFAVYTQGTAYNNMNARTANFMYNEKIYWSTDAWKYDIIKYWPNEIAAGAVDTQSPAAQGAAVNGNVSFFAYAPYVDNSVSMGTYGITSMSANNETRNPWIGYTLNKDHFIDLLWGSKGETSVNVLGTAQAGGAVTTDWDGSAQETGLLNSGNVNVDLTKQKVGGQVKFLFKHALARLGGPAVNTALPNASGFRVKLDIDNSVDGEVPASPAITGGTRESFTVSSTNDAWRTKVTIKNIEITNDLNGNGSYDDGTDGQLPTTGKLDLARGYWYGQDDNAVITKKIGTTVTTPSYTADAALNTKLAETYSNSGTEATWISKAEYATKSSYFLKSQDATHPGVTENFQNVYNDASANPLTLIPGTTPKFKVTITYVVRTYDDKLSTKYTEVTQTISKTLVFGSPVEINKRYNIDMHLGLTTVKFDATVTDWTTGGTEDTDADGNNDSTPVHLPINVL